MAILILGLVLFLGVHSVRIVAPEIRLNIISGKGEGAWKGAYSIVSILGFAVLIWGYGLARENAVELYDPVAGARGLSFVAMPVALVLLFASQFPAGLIKRTVGHPMLWGIIIWAAAHLLNNGDAASVALFGGFLVWAVVDLISCYRRPGTPTAAAKIWPDAAAIILGLGATWLLVAHLHTWFFGVAVA